MVEGARTPLTVDLTGYKVAISAGANGIGKVMADSFAYCGASGVSSAMSIRRHWTTCGHHGNEGRCRRSGAVRGIHRCGGEALGGLDVLVNNAGIAGPTALVEHVTPEELDATLRIDVASMFHMSRRAIPALRANGGGRDRQSVLGRRTVRVRAAGALCGGEMGGDRVHQVAVDRAGSDGIRVNAILPGPVDGPRIRAVIKAKAAAASDLGERDDRTDGGDDEPEVLRDAAGYRQHGAVSGQPVRRHDQRTGDQRGCGHAEHDVALRRYRQDAQGFVPANAQCYPSASTNGGTSP